jgi:hypothetical protein
MAEVLGIVSAGVGIAAFVLQITGRINALQEACKFDQGKAVGELSCLSDRLEALRQTLLYIKAFEGHPIVALTIRNCSMTYSGVDVALKRLLAKFPDEPTDRRRRWKSIKSVISRGGKEEIKEIREKITDAVNDLNL